MLDTGLIRRKIDGLSAADGADTYWRDRMLDALNEVDRLTAELENRKQQFDAYCDAEEINNAGLEQEISILQSALDAADKRNNDLKRFGVEKDQKLQRVFRDFRVTLPPIDKQSEYAAGAQYAMTELARRIEGAGILWMSDEERRIDHELERVV